MANNNLIIYFTAIVIFFMPVSLLSQTETSELNSVQIADNMKYQNGIEFMKINDYTWKFLYTAFIEAVFTEKSQKFTFPGLTIRKP